MMPLFVTASMLIAAYLADETVSGYATAPAYRLIELDGAAFAPEATISFPRKGRVTGTGPCNRYSADQALPYPWFELGDIAATRRACPDLADEALFFATLAEMRLVEVGGQFLRLYTVEGREMVFQALPD